ncbi:MAG: hypothetical protein ACRD6W_16240, partial [Nitrososphaerales archaeon]
HVSVPNSNQFIEASWVRNPAFRGAVRRNILNPDATAVASKMQEARWVQELRSQVPEMEGIKKAASYRRADQQGQGGGLFDQGPQQGADEAEDDQGGLDLDQGGGQGQGQGQGQGLQDQGQGQGDQDQGQGQGGQAPAAPAAPKPDKIDKLLEKAQEQLLSIMVDKLGEKLEPRPEDVGTAVQSPINLEAHNDSIIKSSDDFARLVRKKFAGTPQLVKWAIPAYRIVHEGGREAIRKAGLSSRDLIILSWIEDRCRGRSYPPSLYKAAMTVGALSNYPNQNSFIAACRMNLGRNPSLQERRFLEWKGRIAAVVNF